MQYIENKCTCVCILKDSMEKLVQKWLTFPNIRNKEKQIYIFEYFVLFIHARNKYIYRNSTSH